VRELGKKAKRQQERGTITTVPKRRASGLTVAEEAAAFLAVATTEIVGKISEDAGIAKEDSTQE
jgi:hypothetical protein